jgi:hypothetical protein
MFKILQKKPSIQKLSFCIIMTILTFLFFNGLINDPHGIQLNIFFVKMDDFFADFFNNLRYISDKNPYFNTINGYGEKIYFPLAYLILYPFSCLDSYSTMSLNEIWSSKIAIFSCLIFTIVSLAVLFVPLSSLYGKNKYKLYVLLILFFSGITLFSIERGNTIIITAGCVVNFLVLYKSPFKSYRIIALLFLSIAAVLKVYPIIFGFLLLKDKNYRAIFFCVLVTLILIFLPFVFFEHGFSNVQKLISNIQLNTNNYGPERIYQRFGLPNLIYIVSRVINLPNNIMQFILALSQIFVVVFSLISIILVFFVKERWKEIALLVFVLIQFPVNSGFYCGLYFFPVIVLFLIKNESQKLDWVYIVLFCLFLNPLQLFVVSNISINYIISNVSIIIMWIITIATSFPEFSLKSLIKKHKKLNFKHNYFSLCRKSL